jgi:hypothetical protein
MMGREDGTVFEKVRPRARPGSIPEALDMFRSEVRFYREVRPVLRGVGVRVPACVSAEVLGDGSTRIVLEDLSSLRRGAEPAAVAGALRRLHDAFAGDDDVLARWPWLRRVGAGADLIGAHYESLWVSSLRDRGDQPAPVRQLGASLVGRVAAAEWAEGSAGPLTLCHGDPSVRNVFTDADDEVVFVDWEDVRCASGIVDLAWLLVSSVEPSSWPAVGAAYGVASQTDLVAVLPSVAAQGFFALAGASDAIEAAGWIKRLAAAAERID